MTSENLYVSANNNLYLIRFINISFHQFGGRTLDDFKHTNKAKEIYEGSVWIDLFELIYRHKRLLDGLKELMETTYDVSVNSFQVISISSPG